MRPLIAIHLIFACLLFTSFKGHEGYEEEKNPGSFSATVDGKPFKLREDQLYRGLLMTKSASMDGRTPAKTVISTSFNGTSYDNTDGRLFSELAQFEITYEGEKTGEPSGYAIALQFSGTNYFMLTEGSKLEITKFEWESDRKHFNLSADFNCKLRSFGYPNDGKKDVMLKGRMSDIRITVPSWIANK
jgi:hypothetical protein